MAAAAAAWQERGVGGGGSTVAVWAAAAQQRCRQRQRNVLTYVHMLSLLGTSMLGNSDTKVCRHTVNHVAKIGLSGQKLATFCLVADMSPTFPAKLLTKTQSFEFAFFDTL